MHRPAAARNVWAVVVTAYLAVVTPQAMAGGSIQELLDRVAGPRNAPAGRVDVAASIENSPAGSDLLVTLTAVDGVKLVADPGITVTPVKRAGLTWQNPTGLTDSGSEASYFSSPREIRLPFKVTDAGEVEANVTYAYCIVREQCLFGEKRVHSFVPASPGD